MICWMVNHLVVQMIAISPGLYECDDYVALFIMTRVSLVVQKDMRMSLYQKSLFRHYFKFDVCTDGVMYKWLESLYFLPELLEF